MKELLSFFPKTEFLLKSMPRSLAYRELQDDNLDMAIYPIEENEKIPYEIEYRDILHYSNVLVVNKEHPLAKKASIEKDDIQKYNYLLLDQYSFFDPRNVFHFNESSITFKNADWSIIEGLVEENLGVSGLSEKFISKNNPKIVSKSIDKFFPRMYFSIFTLKEYRSKEAIQYLIKELEKDCDIT